MDVYTHFLIKNIKKKETERRNQYDREQTSMVNCNTIVMNEQINDCLSGSNIYVVAKDTIQDYSEAIATKRLYGERSRTT